jgi:hypothetical protein
VYGKMENRTRWKTENGRIGYARCLISRTVSSTLWQYTKPISPGIVHY